MDTPVVDGTIQVYGARGKKADIPCTRHLVYTGGGLNPGLIVFGNGELLLHCRGVPNHAAREGNVVIRRSFDGGVSWSDPSVIIEKPGVDCRNQEMCIAPDGKLVCIYCERERKSEIAEATDFKSIDWGDQEWRMYAKISWDRGRTWSAPERIPDPPGFKLISPFAGGNIGVLSDETMVAPAFCVPEAQGTYIKQPVETWAAFLITSEDGLHWRAPYDIIWGWSDEVDITEVPGQPGRLVALNRMGGVKFHAIYRQFSIDSGKTWLEPEMVAFDGMHPATSLWIGRDHLMTVGSRRYPYGARAVLSYDGGFRYDWTKQIVFADNCGVGETRKDNGYPTSVMLPDGYLYTVWYKSHADKPYFDGTGETYTAEATRVKWEDIDRYL